MRTVVNWILTICAMVIIIPLFIWCLIIAIAKKIKGKEPMLYSRYIEE